MLDLKAVFESIFSAGQNEQKDHRSEIEQIRPGIYADKEGNLSDRLNRAIERDSRIPDDVLRQDTTTDVVSFVASIKRHKTDTTEVFVGEDSAVAVLAVDGWRKHVIVLPLERSESWKFWSTQTSRLVAHVADDVAAHIDDVASKGISGDKLLGCLSGIEWTSEGSTRVSHSVTGTTIKQSSGERVAELPGQFEIHIPVYNFEDRLHPIRVRLTARKTVDDRVIVFTPIGVSQVERGARRMLMGEIREGLNGPKEVGERLDHVPVFAGRAQLHLDK